MVDLLTNFETYISNDNLRTQVRQLVPAHHLLRDLGSSLIREPSATSARDRILLYLRKHVGEVIEGNEIMVVAGIGEYARRIRELRVQLGWSIFSGNTIKDMRNNAAEENLTEVESLPAMKPDDYILFSTVQDLEAAYRWRLANEIRKDDSLSVQNKLLAFLRKNIGKIVSGEELRYLAKERTEWARRTRELRTELGWPISTKSNGRPDLQIGTYVLENDRQSPPHDRKIKDDVRRATFMRDAYTCQRKNCAWNHDLWNPSDPRHLEAHHIVHHLKRGSNEVDNLITYCNVCHDVVHRKEKHK